MAWNIGTKGGQRREDRRTKRRAKRADKNSNKYLGGSKTEEKRIYDESIKNSGESRARVQPAFDETKAELDQTRKAQKGSAADYNYEKTQADSRESASNASIGGIKDAASAGSSLLGTAGATAQNELTGGAQSAIGTRQNALANGSLVGAVENNVLANRANAQAQQQFSTQLLNRQAMGLAAGQGEGGALALQQAMAGAGAGSADMAAQQNLMLADQTAGLRMDAAAAERANQLQIAGADAQSLEAAAAARAGVGMDVAGNQANMGYNAGLATYDARAKQAGIAQAAQGQANQRDLQLQAQRANLATGNTQLAVGANQGDQDYQANILATKYGAQQNRGTKNTNWLNKGISSVLDPMDIRGSGTTGVGH